MKRLNSRKIFKALRLSPSNVQKSFTARFRAIFGRKTGKLFRDDDIALAEKLLEFERKFPVNSIRFEENGSKLHVWPYMRHLLWVRCQAAYKGKDPSKVFTAKMYISRDWRRHYQDICDIRDLEDIEEQSLDFLFLTNVRGTEQTRIDDKIFNRITDPIFELAQSLGPAKKVEVVKSVGEIYPHRYYDADLIYPPLNRPVGYSAFCSYPRNLFSRLQSSLPQAKMSEGNFNTSIEWLAMQREFYLGLLQKYNPKVVFFVGFDYHYGLIWAAKKLGIVTVDLQHGVHAGWSPVYNHWQAVPKKGYALVPDVFWVWGDYDALKIAENFGTREQTGVQALVGGFPWLERQETMLKQDLPKSIQHKRELKDAKPIGVLTLQDQQKLPQLFIDIIRSTSDQLHWIVKRHPKHQQIDLSDVSSCSDFSQEIDDTSFMALIRHANVHLTECSTSVIEADYYGVPSVVTGPQGWENYKDFIYAGSVHHVNTVDEFEVKLNHIRSAKDQPRMNVIKSNVAEHALRNLLDQTS